MERDAREKQIQEMNNSVITVGKKLRDSKSIKGFLEANTKLLSEKAAVKKREDELKENLRGEICVLDIRW